jgi:hypothetical protein
LDNFTSTCASKKIVESFRLGGLPLLMEKGTRMIRCLAPLETAQRVLYVFRDEPSRFQRANLDDDENEFEDSGEKMEKEKDNARMIVQEIRGAVGA